MIRKTKPSKYKNKRIVVDGEKYDSKDEFNRYNYLRSVQSIFKFELLRQVNYKLIVNGVKICTYRADFVLVFPCGKTIVEDYKGMITREFVLKKKLMKAIYGIDIVVVTKKNINSCEHFAGVC